MTRVFLQKLCAYLVRDKREERKKGNLWLCHFDQFFSPSFCPSTLQNNRNNSHWRGLQSESKRLKTWNFELHFFWTLKPTKNINNIWISSHIIPSFCLQVIEVCQLIKGLHHFVPPKYNAFWRIFIEVIKHFYLDWNALMYYTTTKLENDLLFNYLFF